MAATTQRFAAVPYDELHEQAADVHVGRALATAFAAVFIAIGWIIGRTIYAISFCVASARYGYHTGAKIRRVPSEPQRAARGDGLNKV